MTPSRNASAAILMGVCVTLLACYAFYTPTWPPWAQVVLAVATVAAFPLLGSLGVLKSLGLGATPGSHFLARRMFVGAGFLAAAFVWVVLGVRLMPNPSTAGLMVVLLPALMLFAAAIVFFIRGTLWP